MQEMKRKLYLKENDDSYDIYFYDDIGGRFDYEKWEVIKTSTYLKDKLEEANGRDLNIFVNSAGGEVFEAYSIISMLQRYEEKKTCYIDGMAASCASLIPLICDMVYVYPYSSIMIHNMWTYVVGNANELRRVADDLDKFMKSSIDMYMTKFTDTEEKLKEMIDAETWLNADECIEYGFANEKITSKEEVEEEKEDVPTSDEEETNDDEKTVEEMMKARDTVFAKYAFSNIQAKAKKEEKKEDVMNDFFNELFKLKN